MTDPTAHDDPFPDRAHDHAQCVTAALARAEELCQARGARLTGLGREVLGLVWEVHHPVGAYDLIERMSQGRRPVAPATVYRALDFLREQGLVHRIDSLNAFIGCASPDRRHEAQFLICRGCRNVAEVSDPDLALVLERAATRAGFRLEHRTVELSGLCRAGAGDGQG
jgi:Fur family zinc uptake transcriptional regulator